MTAQIAYLPRPTRSKTPNLDFILDNARGIMRHHEWHPTITVVEACELLSEHGTFHEQIEADVRLQVMRAAERRRHWCMNQPPAVQRRRWAIIAEAAGVVVSASFAIGMMAYVLMGV